MQMTPDIKAYNIGVLAEIAWSLLDEVTSSVPEPQRTRLSTLLTYIHFEASTLSDDVDAANTRRAYAHLFEEYPLSGCAEVRGEPSNAKADLESADGAIARS